ncbi:MAG: radical SAM family heme chaperone HemW [Clostridia bacterium]|nr:radical SAM family heme chaperone HemW [Clostridia bacterium]
MNEPGVYIHLPFCAKRCAYCDFFSSTRLEDIDAYTEALCRQIKESASKETVDTVYFGGGTPSLLGAGRIKKILGALKESFSLSEDCEITAEVNPTGQDEKTLSALKEAGVNRLSVGVQSLDDRELKLIGRLHDARMALKTIAAAKTAGIERISADLIYGLPSQTIRSFRASLDGLIETGVSHLSCYCLTLKEDSPLKKLDLPDEDEQRKMYLDCCERLEAAGIRQYEVSNFARPGQESRHNLKYWTGKRYFGFGAGAHGFDGKERYYIKPDIDAFISRPARELKITEETPGENDRLEEYIIFSLRLRSGIKYKKLASLGGEKTLEKTGVLLPELKRAGLAGEDEEGFWLTPEGMFVSNSVIARLI